MHCVTNIRARVGEVVHSRVAPLLQYRGSGAVVYCEPRLVLDQSPHLCVDLSAVYTLASGVLRQMQGAHKELL